MKMENVGDIEQCKAMYRDKARDDLVLQQVGLRASIHAFEFLIANLHQGATPEMMLASLQGQLFVLHEIAHERGLQLMGYN